MMKNHYPWQVADFNINTKGRDFVAGDLHGEFERLERALTSLNFNQNSDRLFCVGDLIDRGPSSHRIIEFLNQDWFYSIAGNHEWMLYNCHADHKLRQQFWFPNGGNWWHSLNKHKKIDLVNVVESEFYALITINTSFHKIGIVHALPHPNYVWTELCRNIESDQILQNWTLWERDFEAFINKAIDGIDYVFCGHTPMDEPYSVNNLINIDTGCGHQISPWLIEPALTIVELAENFKFHRFS